jgi:hypothetical protein
MLLWNSYKSLSYFQERVALSDEYFVKRNLYPNVDFYSGLIYKAMGFPTDFFPVLFAIARTSGWLAHCLFFVLIWQGMSSLKIRFQCFVRDKSILGWRRENMLISRIAINLLFFFLVINFMWG